MPNLYKSSINTFSGCLVKVSSNVRKIRHFDVDGKAL